MRPLSAPRPARVVLAAAAVAFFTSSLVAASAAARSQDWVPPVGGAVVRPFVAPIAEYAAGHRGVDFAAGAGSAVRASNDGTISFAGTVAGSLHVVVAHENGIRTSYSFLASTDAHAGQRVFRGDVIGRAGGSGGGHDAGVLHFGVRVGDRYVDPMLLFRPRDLTQIVRLVPPEELDAAAAPDSRRDVQELARVVADEDDHDCAGVVGDVADAFGLGDAAESACDALEEAVDIAWRALNTLGEAAQGVVDAFEGVVTAVIERMRTTGESLAKAAAVVADEVAETVERVIEAAVEYARDVYERLTSCPQPAPRKQIRGSGNLALAVSGFDSERHIRNDGTVSASFHFQARKLGYGDGQVGYFSYSATGKAFTKPKTHQDLNISAALLADQLKEFARQHPGQRLDLIGHSQGGVVIYLFLADFYVGHEHEYPRVDNVVTYASPLEGTPLSDLEDAVLDTPIEDLAGDYPLGARALAQLRERSPLMQHLAEARYPRGARYLSLAGSEDAVVPSGSCDPPAGARGQKYVLPIGGTFRPDDHTAILTDADALSAAQAHLSGGAPADTCGPLVDAQSVVETAVVRGATALLDAAKGPRDRPVPEGG